jgi:hypothetical protein
MYKFDPTDNIPSPIVESISTTQPQRNRLLDRLYDFEDLSDVDEYARYLSEPRHNTPNREFDPVNWWLESSQTERFPRLSRMALDLLSAPAMSVDYKRLFSAAKLTVTDLRTRLSSDSVEALLCLKSWQQFFS